MWKTFGTGSREVAALAGVSLAVGSAEFVCLVGPSGCGKTTLLRVMDGLMTPDRGQILMDGLPLAGPGPRIGVVFQTSRLLPWHTVLDNIAFPLGLQGVGRAERHERAAAYVRLVGLEAFSGRYPHELSGGMQQRVGLARALCLEPEILLMDEPFAALDAQTREFMQIELCRIWEERRLAVVFVTHSLDEALFLGDRVVLMRPRPGTVESIIDVPLDRPRWRYDVRVEPEFQRLRHDLWERMREMVADQPEFAHLVAGQS